MNKGTAFTRCPTCGTRRSRIQYGLPAGPPAPGVVLGGCLIGPDNPDYLCEVCGASWRARRRASQHRRGRDRMIRATPIAARQRAYVCQTRARRAYGGHAWN